MPNLLLPVRLEASEFIRSLRTSDVAVFTRPLSLLPFYRMLEQLRSLCGNLRFRTGHLTTPRREDSTRTGTSRA